MLSASPSRFLVNHKYAEDRHLPSEGEIIVLCLSQDLFGPGSIIASHNQPSGVTRYNYHHAVVLGVSLDTVRHFLSFTVLPIPSYSAPDLMSGLSSTSWLLSQPLDFQGRHIPVPYEPSSLTQLQPPFSTPVQFGDPLKVGGWKNRRPSWVLAVPQVTELTLTSTFKCFKPSVKLNEDELRRLGQYSGLFCLPVIPSSSTMSSFPPRRGDSAFGGSNTLPSRIDGTVPSSGSYPSQPGKKDNHPGAGLPAGGRLAFQALYANDAVKQAFASLNQPSMVLDSGSDDDDDDDHWEDRMDPVTFARYYAASSPHLARIVQEYDQKMRVRLDQEITNWAQGVRSVTFEGDAL